MRYITLLRGINVDGNKMIKMAELKKCFEALGFENVTSYINSGNLAFDGDTPDESALKKAIEKAIEQDFGMQVPVMVREQKDIERIIAANPFKGEFESHKEMHVLFLSEKMTKDKEDQLMDAALKHERFAVRGREIFCHLKLGVADSLLGKGFIDKKLKIPITARNWRTVQKLAEL